MKRRIVFIGLLLIILRIGVYGQENEEAVRQAQFENEQKKEEAARQARLLQAQAKGLKIGDTVPDIILDKIVQVDGTVTSGRLSDYKDQLLILDFMYTGCSACIAGLPHKDKLQREFGDRIKILVVVGGDLYSPGMLDRENETFIRKYLGNPESYLAQRSVQIPWVVENKELNHYFPHILASHIVWIYKGKVLAFTEQDYVDRQNIAAVLEGKDPKLPVKNDFMPAVDEHTPLVQQDPARFTGQRPRYYTAVFGAYQDGIESRSGAVVDSVKAIRRDYLINRPLVNVYTYAWMQALDTVFQLDPSQIILEVQDPSRYVQIDDQKEYSRVSRNKTHISYESVRPFTGQTTAEVAQNTIRDLDRLLGLHGRMEERRLKCFVLVRADSTDRLQSKGVPRTGDAELNTPNIKIRNGSLGGIIWKLNQQYGNPPVFDESGYDGRVDMDLQLDSWKDIEALREQLQRYGLDLREEERELQVFVLTEK